jgi:N-acetylornithine carbamoyltransferase
MEATRKNSHIFEEKAMNLVGRNFLNTTDFSQEEITGLIDLALRMKRGEAQRSLAGKVLAMVFFNPSVRTRISFAAAMFRLGGLAVDLTPGQGSWTFEFRENVVMDGATIEHIKEAAPVISRYCHAIGVRSSELVTSSSESVKVEPWPEVKKDKVINGFAKYATVPIINMESNAYHPCQGLGDAMTIKEKLGDAHKKKYVLTWAYHPKALPMATPNSQMLAACDLGMNVTIAHPEGWDLDPEILHAAASRADAAGGSLSITHSQTDALAGADVVCVKSWGAMGYYGNWEDEKKVRLGYKNWIMTADKLHLSNNALLMHCLPVRRNVEISDDALDGSQSIVIDEVENRMWAQMALLAELL